MRDLRPLARSANCVSYYVFRRCARRRTGASNRVEIWPAIDLRGGKCVRLRQGDYQRETVFGDDPAAMARHWVGLGAKHLHLVDLDGAREGRPVNLAERPGDRRGGRRALRTGRRHPQRGRRSANCSTWGLTRLVIGTLAMREPDWFRRMCRKFPGRLVLGIDARDGRVATDGWLETSDVAADRVGPAVRRRAAGGDDLYRHRHRRHAGRAERGGDGRDASGGRPAGGRLRRRDDQRRRRPAGGRAGMAGCIIGRALYEGTLTLPEALAAAGRKHSKSSEPGTRVAIIVATIGTSSMTSEHKDTFMAKYSSRRHSQHRLLRTRLGRQDDPGRQDPDHHRRGQPPGQRRRRHQHLRLRRGGEAAQVHDRGHAWSTSTTAASTST